MDPREMPFNGRVAHVSLKGKVEAERFVDGEPKRVQTVTLPILDQPEGERTRELLLGETFRVLDEMLDHAFGFDERSGYVGYVPARHLGPSGPVTDVVRAARSYAKSKPSLKSGTDDEIFLSFGSRLHVVGEEGDWAKVDSDPIGVIWVPLQHLRPVDERLPDPAAVAELFLHTPYLWGGNTAFGIDCSGLIQAALLACGIPCPGDSDQQETRVGMALAPDSPLQRGDLIFWKGHVAMALDGQNIIHANAHHMAVAIEPFDVASARIATSGGGDVTSLRRP